MRFWFSGPRIFGRRTGISFGPQDFQANARSGPGPSRPTTNPSPRPPSFIYVIKSEAGPIKLGITADPIARLAGLQTASASRLELAYVAVPKSDDGYAIEQVAHNMLVNHRLTGEWFETTPELAVAAIGAASFRLKDPIVEIPIDKISTVLAIAAKQDQFAAAQAPRRHLSFQAKWGIALLLVTGFFPIMMIWVGVSTMTKDGTYEPWLAFSIVVLITAWALLIWLLYCVPRWVEGLGRAITGR
jgi:hypothetical protein